MLAALLVAFAFALVCLLYDATTTQKGIKAGVAVEGNPLIVAAFGNKPSLLQCLAIDLPIRLALMTAFLFIPAPARYPLAWYAMGTGAFMVYGLKNVQGARQWNWMLKNPGKPLPQPTSIWQQFLGFWG